MQKIMDEKSLIEYLPFATLVTGSVKESPLLTGLAEKLILSFVAAGFALYGNNIIMSKDIESIKSIMIENKKQIDRIEDRQYVMQQQISTVFAEGKIRRAD